MENDELKNVEVVESTELVEGVADDKKTKIVKAVKTGLKVAGVAAVGLIGYLIGSSRKNNVECEYSIDNSIETNTNEE